MCHSGQVAHLQDSDEYCAIEMAPFAYEQNWIEAGGYEIQSFAKHLSNWTTAVHRANAHIPVIYHSVDLPETPLQMMQESADFIGAVEEHLSPTCHPVRGHYYWMCCIESILYKILKMKERSPYFQNGTLFGVVGSPTFSPIWGNRGDDRALFQLSHPPTALPQSPKQMRKTRLKKIMTGLSPYTSWWHVDWYDDYQMRRDIQDKMTRNGNCVVIAFEPIAECVDWLEHTYPGRSSYVFYDFLLLRKPSELETFFQDKQHVLIWLTEDHFCELGSSLRSCSKYLQSGSSIAVYLKHKNGSGGKHFLRRRIAICKADLLNSQITCEKVESYYSISRHFWRISAHYTHKLFSPKRRLGTRVIGFLGLSTLAVITALGNLFSLLKPASKKKSTSAILHFKCQIL